VVDVVSDHHRATSVSDWSFVKKLGILPVFVEAFRLGDTHCVDATPGRFQSGTAHSHDPIIDLSFCTYPRHASRQCAKAMERVGRKPEVTIDDVHVQIAHSLADFRRTGVNC